VTFMNDVLLNIRNFAYSHGSANVSAADRARSLSPLLESEPSLPTAGPKLLNSTKNHNVRCRINKF